MIATAAQVGAFVKKNGFEVSSKNCIGGKRKIVSDLRLQPRSTLKTRVSSGLAIFHASGAWTAKILPQKSLPLHPTRCYLSYRPFRLTVDTSPGCGPCCWPFFAVSCLRNREGSAAVAQRRPKSVFQPRDRYLTQHRQLPLGGMLLADLRATPPKAGGPIKECPAWKSADNKPSDLETPAAPRQPRAAAKRKAAQHSRQHRENTSPAKASKPKSQRKECRCVTAVGSAINAALNKATSNPSEPVTRAGCAEGAAGTVRHDLHAW